MQHCHKHLNLWSIQEKLMSYPQEMLLSMAPSPTPNGHLACTQNLTHTHTWTLTHSSEGCHVYPGVWLCCSTLQMSQRQKSVFWPESLQAASVSCRATFVYANVCVCCCICARICTCVCVLLIPRGWGWEKQVRKQQNKLRDNEESNTGTCFPRCGGRRIHLRYTAWSFDVLMPLMILSLDISVQQHALYHLYLSF